MLRNSEEGAAAAFDAGCKGEVRVDRAFCCGRGLWFKKQKQP